MISEGLLAKIALVPGAGFLIVEVLPKILNEGFGALAVTAGGLAATGYLIKRGRRAARYFRQSWGRIQDGLDIIESTPADFKAVHKRLDEHAERLDQHGRSLGVIADADEHRIKDAIAGDHRSPVDRRAA